MNIYFNIKIILISFILFSCRETINFDDEKDIPQDSNLPIPAITDFSLTINGTFNSSSKIKRFTMFGFKDVEPDFTLYGTGNKSQNIWMQIGDLNKGLVVKKMSPLNRIGMDLVICMNTSIDNIDFVVDTLYKQLFSYSNYLAGYGIDLRVGAVGFKGDVRGYFDFTNDIIYFRNWIRNSHFVDSYYQYLYPKIGLNSDYENPISALKFASMYFSWRANALRSFIIITDKPIYAMNSVQYSTEYINKEMLGKYLINVIFLGDATKYEHLWTPSNNYYQNPIDLAKKTGGNNYNFTNYNFNLMNLGMNKIFLGSHSIEFLSESGEKFVMVQVKLNEDKSGKAYFKVNFY